MSKSYWRWHKRYAVLPVKVQDEWIWLKPYWWRVIFDIDRPIRMIYRTANPPEFDYTDKIVAEEGARQMMARRTR